MEDKYFELYHVYEDKAGEEFIKYVGMYSTPQEAWRIIKLLRCKSGFREHSQKCFHICRCYIDLVGWQDGFFTVTY